MRVAIMQPYLLPYIGYFQLIAAADEFIIYDTVKYTKKGWVNRNRFLRHGEPVIFTLPLEKASDALEIRERRVSASFASDQLCRQIAQAYRLAPQFDATMPLVEAILNHKADNLFAYLHHALVLTCAHLQINTPIRIASEIGDDVVLRGQDRVIDICLRLGAGIYINPIGGTSLYDPASFARNGIALRFLRARPFAYAQLGHPFVPWLSIVDVMMFNAPSSLDTVLREGHDIITGEDNACPVGASLHMSSTPGRSTTAPG